MSIENIHIIGKYNRCINYIPLLYSNKDIFSMILLSCIYNNINCLKCLHNSINLKSFFNNFNLTTVCINYCIELKHNKIIKYLHQLLDYNFTENDCWYVCFYDNSELLKYLHKNNIDHNNFTSYVEECLHVPFIIVNVNIILYEYYNRYI